ncbi:hypothetical protein F5050DRAFT_1772859 [Lentinula boryana]|uniref:Secreted protein n=1 Tax=Lentinula boryana TaxID=40481 RepID=A0ABQ8Q836_9AGAR|nr:hypothetical protein F5050DRAFT_1772859 [Lentinula boryana]
MFSKGLVLALVLFLVRLTLGYRQPYEYLEALDTFGAAFSNPAGVFKNSGPHASTAKSIPFPIFPPRLMCEESYLETDQHEPLSNPSLGKWL